MLNALLSADLTKKLHTIACSIAFLGNLLTLYLIATKSNKSVGRYAYLLFSFCCGNLMLTATDLAIVPRELFKALIIQLLIPLFCNYIPVGNLFFSSIFGGIMVNVECTVLLVLVDQMMEPLVIIYFIKCYR
ncbi:unnamed protein product, partial [Mesorhabditis spiculigera]